MSFIEWKEIRIIAYRKLFWNLFEIQYVNREGTYNVCKVWFSKRIRELEGERLKSNKTLKSFASNKELEAKNNEY